MELVWPYTKKKDDEIEKNVFHWNLQGTRGSGRPSITCEDWLKGRRNGLEEVGEALALG